MAAERETKLYECEVKRRRVRTGGGYEPFWKVKNVGDALVDADTEFRCKDCFGEVKLFRSHGRRRAGRRTSMLHKWRVDLNTALQASYFRSVEDGLSAAAVRPLLCD